MGIGNSNAGVTRVDMRLSLIFKVGVVILIILEFVYFYYLGPSWWWVLLIFCTAYGLLDTFLTFYQVDDIGIRKRSIVRKGFFLPWEAIVHIDKNIRFPNGYYYRLVTKNWFEVRITSSMTGIRQFEALAKKHLPEERWKAFGEKSTIIAASQ